MNPCWRWQNRPWMAMLIKKALGTFSNDNCDIFKAFDASDAHIQQETWKSAVNGKALGSVPEGIDKQFLFVYFLALAVSFSAVFDDFQNVKRLQFVWWILYTSATCKVDIKGIRMVEGNFKLHPERKGLGQNESRRKCEGIGILTLVEREKDGGGHLEGVPCIKGRWSDQVSWILPEQLKNMWEKTVGFRLKNFYTRGTWAHLKSCWWDLLSAVSLSILRSNSNLVIARMNNIRYKSPIW